MKYREIPFRCSETGKRFAVIFRQYSSSHKFQIFSIISNEDEMNEFLEVFSSHLQFGPCVRPGNFAST